jgi:hypothetical protein
MNEFTLGGFLMLHFPVLNTASGAMSRPGHATVQAAPDAESEVNRANS